MNCSVVVVKTLILVLLFCLDQVDYCISLPGCGVGLFVLLGFGVF